MPAAALLRLLAAAATVALVADRKVAYAAQGFSLVVSPCANGGGDAADTPAPANQSFGLKDGQLQWLGHYDSTGRPQPMCVDGACTNPISEKCTPIGVRPCGVVFSRWLAGKDKSLRTAGEPPVCIDLWNGGRPPYSALGLYVCDAARHPNQRWTADATNRRIVSADNEVTGPPLCLTATPHAAAPPPHQPQPLPTQVYEQVSPSSYPLAVLELASDDAWRFRIVHNWRINCSTGSPRECTTAGEPGGWRRIRVPGGGFNSDLQDPPLISALVGDSTLTQREIDFNSTSAAEYRRNLTVGAGFGTARGTVMLEFGAVNYGALVFLAGGAAPQGCLLAAHYGPMMPFAVKLPALSPGVEYELIVQVLPYERFPGIPSCFVYPDAWRTFPASRGAWGGCKTTQCRSKFSMGISRGVRLAAYPMVRVSSVRLWPNFQNRTLRFEATIRNDSPDQTQAVELHGKLSQWQGRPAWNYPAVPPSVVSVPASGQVVVSATVAWNLPKDSLWFPNKPYAEDYLAVLHWLNLTLTDRGGGTVHRFDQRFGFADWRDDLIPGKWSINGVAVNFISDATPESGMSHYDCYTQSSAFNTIDGARETWRRYMRLGISSNRIHQSTPTQVMLDAADEVGFTLRPETGLRGGGAHDPDQEFDDVLSTQSVQELAHACRGHPSVASYSLQNECSTAWVPSLIDAIVEVDDSTPLVWENSGGCKDSVLWGKESGAHAVCMDHYSIPKVDPTQITGEGECAWCSYHGIGMQGQIGTIERLSMLTWQGRVTGLNYISGWDWLNYWPNFLVNMSYAQHAWKQPECPDTARDRVVNATGWGSPLIDWVQRAFHPFLVLVVEDWQRNPSFTTGWPRHLRNGTSGELLRSQLVVFNDGMEGEDFLLRVELHWDSATGPVAASPLAPAKLVIKRGFNVMQNVSTMLPYTTTTRRLFMVINSQKGDEVVYTEDRLRVLVHPTQ